MENLPDEVLLTIVNYLDIKSITKFGQVCTRTREISRDESLWRKTVLFNKKVCPEFVKFILDNGCRYLSFKGQLISERNFGVFKSPKKTNQIFALAFKMDQIYVILILIKGFYK